MFVSHSHLINVLTDIIVTYSKFDTIIHSHLINVLTDIIVVYSKFDAIIHNQK
jgi:hypothetical protein